ncbi:AIPR family protein [Streptosporangium saharense]|uniref:AIPR family protein n=1 Tax=Streptosporangium saharense TaxID=1706840 RepID=UPI0033240271
MLQELHRLRLQAGNPSFRKLAGLIDNKGSHTTLASVFNGRHIPRWDIVEALGTALGADQELLRQLWVTASAAAEHGATAEERRDADVLDQYCQRLLSRSSLSAASSQRRSGPPPSDQYRRQLIDPAGGRISAAEFESRIERTVILAEAGMGKTLLATNLVHSSAEHRRQAAFLISMAELVNRAAGPPVVAQLIDDHIGTTLQTQSPTGLADRLLNAGSHLVIFDGLDEAAVLGRGALATQIIEAFAARYPRCRVLVTSRPEPKLTLDPQTFVSYILAALEPKEAENLANAWFVRTYGPERGAELATSFLELIRDIPGVLNNPALLRGACEAFGRHQGEDRPVTDRLGNLGRPAGIGVAIHLQNQGQGEPLQDIADQHELVVSGGSVERAALTQRETRVSAPQLQDGQPDAWTAFLLALRDHQASPLPKAGRTHQRQVGQISQALRRRFGDLIDEHGSSDHGATTAFLGKALAALVVQTLLACDDRAAVACLARPRTDLGFDAIAVAESSATIWIIQTKWRAENSRPAFTEVDILKAAEGIRQLDEGRLERLTADDSLVQRLHMAFNDPRCTIRLVMAGMSRNVITHGALDRLQSLKGDFNLLSDVLDYEVWDTRRIHTILSDAQTGSKVNITAELDGWSHLDGPFDTYIGVISAVQVARWLDQHRDNLFAGNLRRSLGGTEVNRAIVDTLTNRPEEFFYFNNGITVVCDEAMGRFRPGSSRSSHLALDLTGATIVNGAQTVAAIHAAVSTAPEAAAQAIVMIRIIVAGGRNSNLTTDLARASNFHHPPSERDFAALDPVQTAIRDDLGIGLGKEYAYKRGQAVPAPEAGCTIDEAALALACAHADSNVVISALQRPDLLWRTDRDGLYSTLFSAAPSGLRIWRSVDILRRVRQYLSAATRITTPAHLALPDEADILITHLVYHRLATTGIEDPETDWAAALDQAQEHIVALTEHLSLWWTSTPHAGEILSDARAIRKLVDNLRLSLPESHHDS